MEKKHLAAPVVPQHAIRVIQSVQQAQRVGRPVRRPVGLQATPAAGQAQRVETVSAAFYSIIAFHLLEGNTCSVLLFNLKLPREATGVPWKRA